MIEIRVRRDGTVYFGALTAELLEAAAAVNPRDAHVAKKLAALRGAALGQGSTENQTAEETIDVAGDANAGT